MKMIVSAITFAQVTCRQLGFSGGSALPGETFGKGTGGKGNTLVIHTYSHTRNPSLSKFMSSLKKFRSQAFNYGI